MYNWSSSSLSGGMEALFSVIFRLTGPLCTVRQRHWAFALWICATTRCLWPWETPQLSWDLLSCQKHPVRCLVNPDSCSFFLLQTPNIFLFYLPYFQYSFFVVCFFSFVKLSWSSRQMGEQWSLSLILTCFLFSGPVALPKDLTIWLVTPALFPVSRPFLSFYHLTRSRTHFYSLSSLKLAS